MLVEYWFYMIYQNTKYIFLIIYNIDTRKNTCFYITQNLSKFDPQKTIC